MRHLPSLHRFCSSVCTPLHHICAEQIWCKSIFSSSVSTVELGFSEPLYNEVLGITNDIRQPGQSYSKMYGTEPRYNEILVITSTIQKPERKTYLDITNKCQHATEKMNAKQIGNKPTGMKRQFFSAVAMYRSVQCTLASYRH